MASLGRLYSDLDSGDEEESQNSRTNVKTMNAADEVDESKFFAGVFTSQRSEEDLTEYVNSVFFTEDLLLQMKSLLRRHRDIVSHVHSDGQKKVDTNVNTKATGLSFYRFSCRLYNSVKNYSAFLIQVFYFSNFLSKRSLCISVYFYTFHLFLIALDKLLTLQTLAYEQ